MTDFNELLRQVKEEMAVEPVTTLKKEKPIDVNVALSSMKKEAEANRDPRLKYIDKFKDQMLDTDYKDLCRKIDVFDLRQDEIDAELRMFGINV